MMSRSNHSQIDNKGAKTPHVLMIAPLFPPFRGAAASRLSSFAKYWSEFTKVTVISPYFEELKENEYSQIRFPLACDRFDPLLIPFNFPKLHRICREIKPDVVFSSIPPVWSLLEGYLLAKRLGVPLVFDVRDLPTADGRQFRTSLWRMIFHAIIVIFSKFFGQRASRIVTVTDWFRERLAEFLEIPSESIYVVRNGSEIEHFKSALSVKKDFDLIYSGSFIYIRNSDAVLQYFKKLKDLRPSLKVCFSSDLSTRFGQSFLSDIRKVGLSHTVTVKRMCDPKLLPQRLGSAYLGLTSLKTGYEAYRGVASAKLYEYLAAGLPVVGLFDPEFYVEEGRLILENDAGIVSSDPIELAQKTVALLNNTSRMKEMSKRARKTGERFDRERLAKRYYMEVILPSIENV